MHKKLQHIKRKLNKNTKKKHGNNEYGIQTSVLLSFNRVYEKLEN